MTDARRKPRTRPAVTVLDRLTAGGPITGAEFAALLGIGPTKFWSLRREGKIPEPTINFGRRSRYAAEVVRGFLSALSGTDGNAGTSSPA